MEIVLAFLFFLGGFTMGTISDDKTGDDTPPTSARPPADGVSDTTQATQVRRPSGSIRCDARGTIIYRDLTLPIGHPNRPQPGQAGGPEGVRPDD